MKLVWLESTGRIDGQLAMVPLEFELPASRWSGDFPADSSRGPRGDLAVSGEPSDSQSVGSATAMQVFDWSGVLAGAQ